MNLVELTKMALMETRPDLAVHVVPYPPNPLHPCVPRLFMFNKEDEDAISRATLLAHIYLGHDAHRLEVGVCCHNCGSATGGIRRDCDRGSSD